MKRTYSLALLFVRKLPIPHVGKPAGLRDHPAGCRGFGTAALLPELRGAPYCQGRRNYRSENVVWSGGGSQPTLESLLVSTERPQDIPAGGGMAAWDNQSGTAISGNQVGLVDSV